MLSFNLITGTLLIHIKDNIFFQLFCRFQSKFNRIRGNKSAFTRSTTANNSNRHWAWIRMFRNCQIQGNNSFSLNEY